MSALQALFHRLFGSTINGAMFHFNKAIQELEAVENREVEVAKRKKQDILELQTEFDAATREATRARNKANKLRAMFGDSDEDEEPNIATLKAVQ